MSQKCIPSKYHEGELSKGEAICLDRCVSKFMDVQERAGKKLTAMRVFTRTSSNDGTKWLAIITKFNHSYFSENL